MDLVIEMVGICPKRDRICSKRDEFCNNDRVMKPLKARQAAEAQTKAAAAVTAAGTDGTGGGLKMKLALEPQDSGTAAGGVVARRVFMGNPNDEFCIETDESFV